MNLWVSGLFLVVGLFLSSSALTEEECKPLIEPLSMDDHSGMIGEWYFIGGYNDNDALNAILKSTQSTRVNVTQSPTAPNEVLMTQENRINGTCFGSETIMTINGFTAQTQMINVTSSIQSLSSCDSCMLFHISGNSTKMTEVLEKLHFENVATEQEVSFHALYLMAKSTTLEDSAIEHFKKQAGCLGFTGEPSFHFDPKNSFCDQDEIVQLTPHVEPPSHGDDA
ncbi:uncharacterized protein LOC141802847 [Halichoeres trimaculatus]|uniref:uncharacterized protein LOC141802847 n=1 Tax=Halichoeres trimaculatus TaxID=147232 RepID=UPI003D9F8810